MITIIFGGTGTGKTGLLVFVGNEAAFDIERNFAMKQEIRFMNANGFRLTVPQHAVASNVDMTFRKPYAYPRKPRIIDPARLGTQILAPEGVKCHYTLPYETILIDEAQGYFYSKGGNLEKYKIDFFEENRHNDLNIYMAAPSAALINKDIRRISVLCHIQKRELVYKRDGSVETRWTVNEVEPGEFAFEDYVESLKTGSNINYKTKKIIAPYNIFNLYNPKGNRSKFIEGHLDEDFDLKYMTNSELITLDDYKRHEAIFKKGGK